MTLNYTVDVERSGRWWNLTFPDAAFVYSQVRRLDQVEAAARRALALKLDVLPESFDVHVRMRLPGDLEQALATVAERRHGADIAQRDATDATRALIQSLSMQGYSVRDIGELIGLSPQRVSQLTSRKPALAERRNERSPATTQVAGVRR